MINKIVDNNRCTGCGACVNACKINAITMSEDEYGFFIPQLSDNCVKCGKCLSICPVNSKPNDSDKTIAFAAYSNNNDIRKNSSSGGVFSHLAEEVLKSGGSVYGAAFDTDFSVKHICIDEASQLNRLQGSKYVQSNTGNCFTEIREKLNSGASVLFSGTPCQCEGLKSFLEKDYGNLYLIDTVCHSVPSPLAWRKYVEYKAKNEGKGELPIKINLRDKASGWSRYNYSCLFEYPNGKRRLTRNYEDIYMKLFTSGNLNRPSCSECGFRGYNRATDITLGDFWGIWDLYPEMDDDLGTSLLLVHSEKGTELLNAIKADIALKEVTLEDASQSNQAIIKSTVPKRTDNSVLKRACNGEYKELEKEFKQKVSVTDAIKNKAYCVYSKFLSGKN